MLRNVLYFCDVLLSAYNHTVASSEAQITRQAVEGRQAQEYQSKSASGSDQIAPLAMSGRL
jgi:hypothetical protein